MRSTFTTAARKWGWFAILKMLGHATGARRLLLLVAPIGFSGPNDILSIEIRSEETGENNRYVEISDGTPDDFPAAGIRGLTAGTSDFQDEAGDFRFFRVSTDGSDENSRTILCLAGCDAENFSPKAQSVLDEALRAIGETRFAVFEDIADRKIVEMTLLEREMESRENEFRYRMLYDHSNDAIHLIDGNTITDCNRRTLETYGYSTREEFIAVDPKDLAPEFQADGHPSPQRRRHYIEQVRRSTPLEFEWLARKKDGSTFESVVRLLPLPGKEGTVQAVVRDVTGEKAAARVLEYNRAYISLLAEVRKSFYRQSEQEIVQTFLDSATKLFHLEKAWYGIRIGNSIRPVFHAGRKKNFVDVSHVDIEPARDDSFPLIQAIQDRRAVAVEQLDRSERFESLREFRTQSGFRSCLAIPVEIQGKIEAGAVFYSNETGAFDSSIVDYFPESVKELARIIEEKRHLSQQQRALNKAKETAEAAARSRSQFLANMSHEIRTPMTSILGYTEILLQDHLDSSTGAVADRWTGDDCLAVLRECRSVAGIIQNNAVFLLSILNDILDFSKIEAEKVELELRDVPIRPFLYELASMYSVQAAAKGLRFSLRTSTSVPAVIQTDPTRLKQVLVNLLGNAVKFTQTGDVEVTLGWARNEMSRSSCRTFPLDSPFVSGRLLFAVRDTGIGISQNYISTLFTPFHQGDASTTRRFGGTGLGLAISRRLMRLLGGELSVSSRLEQGSTFTVVLPQKLGVDVPFEQLPELLEKDFESLLLRSSDLPSDATEPSEHRFPLSGCRILLVEDGADNQRLFSFMLKKAGAEVFSADNGRQAVEIALENLKNGSPFGIILMDMQMPIMDGYTATRNLRRNGYTGPIVALTAHALSEERSRCLKAGCDDYLTKPILREALIDGVLKNARY